LEFVASSLEKMKYLRQIILPRLLKEYEVDKIKQKQILTTLSNRTLQGVL